MNKTSDRKIRDVVDKLLYTRFWDKGQCSSCHNVKTSIFGPEEHSKLLLVEVIRFFK